ncbi:hypothetical protein [Steroidobacter agaridevorans]|uniref:hypothetical protein n=1 Tax=Steroidobacter agaridevorans TaxID=2695856 RepID=UPI0013225DBD|nr:hypothetical protein [Steroidobacter agaridevorans]GFE89589.1 hypothetical protein GCM10011488_45430 [Steroidobacter agaridevorans]
MKVIDHDPQTWFLLEDEGALFLDGNYNHSFVGYDWMIQLSAGEVAKYRARGPDELYKKASAASEAWKQASR